MKNHIKITLALLGRLATLSLAAPNPFAFPQASVGASSAPGSVPASSTPVATNSLPATSSYSSSSTSSTSILAPGNATSTTTGSSALSSTTSSSSSTTSITSCIWASSATSVNSADATSITAMCNCNGNPTPASTTLASNTAWAVCGTSSIWNPNAPAYSSQPRISGIIAYGNLNPNDLMSSVSASCVSGCEGTSTTQATTVAVTLTPVTSAGAAVTTHAYLPDKESNIWYDLDVVTTILQQDVDDTEFPAFAQVFDSMVPNATYSMLVDEWLSFYGTSAGQWEQYWGPSYVALERYSYNPKTGDYSIPAGQYSITVSSFEPGNIFSCSDIVGEISPFLGLLTEDNIGTYLGILGELTCDIFSGF